VFSDEAGQIIGPLMACEVLSAVAPGALVRRRDARGHRGGERDDAAPRPRVLAPLDSERALAVIRILNDMARQFETAIIVVTHDEKIIPAFKRVYHIRDGVTHEEAGEARAFE
jgi:hypothetical protein